MAHPEEHKKSKAKDAKKEEKGKAQEKAKVAAKVSKQVGSGLQRFLANSNWTYISHKEDKNQQHILQLKTGTPKATPKASAKGNTTLKGATRKGGKAPKLNREDSLAASRAFSTKEITEAVETVKSSKNDDSLREAVGLLREVTGEGDEVSVKKLLNLYAVPPLLALLAHKDAAIVEDAVMCFRNMLIRHPRVKTVITNEGILLPFLTLLKETQNQSIKANVVSVLPHLVRGKTDAITLRSSGAVPALIQMLQVAPEASLSTSRPYSLESPGAASLCSPAGFGIVGFPSFSSSATDLESPRSTLASPQVRPNSGLKFSMPGAELLNSSSGGRGSLWAVSKLDADIPEAQSHALSEEPAKLRSVSHVPGGPIPHSAPVCGIGSRGWGRSDRLQAVQEVEGELDLSLEEQCWDMFNGDAEDSEEIADDQPLESPGSSNSSMKRRSDLTIVPTEGSPDSLEDEFREFTLPERRVKSTTSEMGQNAALPLHEDACVALSLLVKFEPVLATMMENGAMRAIVRLANAAEGAELQEPVATILQHMAKAQGGAEALCFQDGGAGLQVLTRFASICDGTAKLRAVDGLEACAAASPVCGQLVMNLRVLE